MGNVFEPQPVRDAAISAATTSTLAPGATTTTTRPPAAGSRAPSPTGVASTDAYAVLGWDDTRNTDTSIGDNTYLGGGVQDVYIAASQFEEIGGGTSNAAKVVLAGVVGLLVVGLVLLLGAMLTRSQTGGVTEAAEATKAATTKVT